MICLITLFYANICFYKKTLIFNERQKQQLESKLDHFGGVVRLKKEATKCIDEIERKKHIQKHKLVYILINIISEQSNNFMNPQNSQPQYKPVYYLQRPHSPKTMLNHAHSAKNISMTMSIGANQTANNFLPSYKTRQELPQTISSETSIPVEVQKNERQLENELKIIFKQNASLREENQILKRQLQKFRKETHDGMRSTQKHSSPSPEPSYELRNTIKKEAGEIKQMRIKVDMLSKQVKTYQQLIDKMDERIKKLSHENNKKNSQIDQLEAELTRLDQLKEKTNIIMRMYSDLESRFNDHQLEWMKWKQNWLSQKEIYLEKIKELEFRLRGQ